MTTYRLNFEAPRSHKSVDDSRAGVLGAARCRFQAKFERRTSRGGGDVEGAVKMEV